MPFIYVVLYALVVLFFFIMGKRTARHEGRDAFFATLASLLWPISVVAVLISVLYSEFSASRKPRRSEGKAEKLQVAQPVDVSGPQM